jgi:lipoprotein-releasing system permease protein
MSEYRSKFTLYPLFIGWRYLRSNKYHKNAYLSFISLIALLGLSLGVATLIIVLSVMNGFQDLLRDRVLTVVSHIELQPKKELSQQALQTSIDSIQQIPGIQGVAPLLATQALLSYRGQLQGIQVRGIDPLQESNVSLLATHAQTLLTDTLVPGQFNALVGKTLADKLQLYTNEKGLLITPSQQITPIGILPRTKQVNLQGILQTGYPDYDQNLVIMHLQDSERIFTNTKTGIRVQLDDIRDTPAKVEDIRQQLGATWEVSSWVTQNSVWFAAMELEKRLMFIILSLIIAIATFNLFSTMAMTVAQKKPSIAILKTLGVSPLAIVSIFLLQGLCISLAGIISGFILGLLGTTYINEIVSGFERLFHIYLFFNATDIQTQIPSQVKFGDIGIILWMAFSLSLLFVWFPSWRASRLNPADTLRYE